MRPAREEVEYQSNGDEEVASNASSEAVELTEEEVKLMNAKVVQFKDMLEGIVSAVQIERKVISLEFDEEAIDNWANSLVVKDKRIKGLKEFEWNETETKGEKLQKRKKAA